MNELEEKLTENEIKIIKENTDDDFYFKNINDFDDMFDEMKEYCEENYIMIFDKCLHSFELVEFIKDSTRIKENIYKKNLLEEIEYKTYIENEHNKTNDNDDNNQFDTDNDDNFTVNENDDDDDT